MSFLDKFAKKYKTNAMCFNCGNTSEISVPKGQPIDAFIKSEACICSTCGCATLRRVMRVRAPSGVQEPLQEEYHSLPTSSQQKSSQSQTPKRRLVVPPRAAVRPSPQQSPQQTRRALQPPQYRARPHPPQRMQVEYPITEPVPVQEEKEEESFQRPEWNSQPKKINFWTGREEK